MILKKGLQLIYLLIDYILFLHNGFNENFSDACFFKRPQRKTAVKSMAMPYFECGTHLPCTSHFNHPMQQAYTWILQAMQQPVVLVIKEDPTFALFSPLPSRIIV